MTVLIIGAGPVGLTAAIELTRYGVPVRIVDSAPARSTTSKALVIWSRTLELFSRTGCADALIREGNTVTSVSIGVGSKPIGIISTTGVPSPFPFALMLPQNDTERILETFLSDLGIVVERQVQLVQFAATQDGVTATLRHANGRDESVESDWLLGCDGAHSFVRKHLGLEFSGDTLPSDWILADVHLTGAPGSASELQLIWHEEGVLALFPITPERYRVIANVELSNAQHAPAPSLEDVQAVMDRRGPGGMTASAPIWLSSFRINERKVADYRSGRAFLAGDAAHVHSPAGGQGMNTGMQDACNLAWKLALVANGHCAPEPLLGSYSPERSAVGAQILAASGRLTALAITKNHTAQFVRNHVMALLFGFSVAREKFVETLAEISVGYPDSPLNRSVGHAHGAPAAGSRAPLRAGEAYVGAGNAPRFAIFGGACDASVRLMAQYADLVEPHVREPFAPGSLTLVRPDGYTALAARRDDWDDLATYLAELRGTAALSGSAAAQDVPAAAVPQARQAGV